MRAVVTVIGHDTVGIIAKVSTLLADHGVNVSDISQSVLSDLFAMIMLCDISRSTAELSILAQKLAALGKEQNLQIQIMHEGIFNSMHKI